MTEAWRREEMECDKHNYPGHNGEKRTSRERKELHEKEKNFTREKRRKNRSMLNRINTEVVPVGVRGGVLMRHFNL